MHDLPTTILGVMHVELRIPLCNSLKEKRSVLKPCIHFLRKQWNLAVAEVGDQDVWRSAILAVATVSNDRNLVENTLREARDYFYSRNGIEVLDAQTEIL
jgi:uncharacterized protein